MHLHNTVEVKITIGEGEKACKLLWKCYFLGTLSVVISPPLSYNTILWAIYVILHGEEHGTCMRLMANRCLYICGSHTAS